MGTGWAVGAAATLGLTAALLLRAAGGDTGMSEAPAILPFLLPFVFGAWAYAVSMGAHGNRGALVALTVYAAVAGMGLSVFHLVSCLRGPACPPQDLALQGITALVAGLTLMATVDETRKRRGAIRWGDALFLLVPLALTVAILLVVAMA